MTKIWSSDAWFFTNFLDTFLSLSHFHLADFTNNFWAKFKRRAAHLFPVVLITLRFSLQFLHDFSLVITVKFTRKFGTIDLFSTKVSLQLVLLLISKTKMIRIAHARAHAFHLNHLCLFTFLEQLHLERLCSSQLTEPKCAPSKRERSKRHRNAPIAAHVYAHTKRKFCSRIKRW